MSPPIWRGATPTGSKLERMPLPWFHNAIDRLLAETVPELYWRKVVARHVASNDQGVQQWPSPRI